jgi:hypothetical protein
MLSNELMGTLTLGILVVNGLLLVAAAWQELSKLRALGRVMRPLAHGKAGVGLVEAVVAKGAGEGGELARHEVEQVGRSTDAGGIAFSDRAHKGAVMGGELAWKSGDGAAITIHVPALSATQVGRAFGSSAAEVWVEPEARERAASCPSRDAFATAFGDAKRARGWNRAVMVDVKEGDRVWISGEIEMTESGAARVRPAPGGALIVSTVDPRTFMSSARARIFGFIAFASLALGVCVAVSLWPPHFGTISKIGAVLGIAYFLGVTPIGTAVRDSVRPPSRAFLRGRWDQPTA